MGLFIPYRFRQRLAATAAVTTVVTAITTVRITVSYELAVTPPRVARNIGRRRTRTNRVNQILALLLEQGTHLELRAFVAELVHLALNLTELGGFLTSENLCGRISNRFGDVASLTLGLVSNGRETALLAYCYAIDSVRKPVGLLAELQLEVAFERSDAGLDVAAALTQLRSQRSVARIDSIDNLLSSHTNLVANALYTCHNAVDSGLNSANVAMQGRCEFRQRRLVASSEIVGQQATTVFVTSLLGNATAKTKPVTEKGKDNDDPQEPHSTAEPVIAVSATVHHGEYHVRVETVLFQERSEESENVTATAAFRGHRKNFCF